MRRRDNFGAPLERRRDRFGHWANTGTLLPTQSAGARPHQHSIGWRHGTRGALINSFDSLAARRARSSPRGKLVDRLRSTLCAARTLRGCAVGQHGAHCSPRYRTGLDRTNTATGRRHGIRGAFVLFFKSRGARRARSSARGKSANRPRSTLRAARTWRGCVVGECGARCSPRRRPGLGYTNTASGSRHGLREVVTVASEFRGARRLRSFLCGKSADRLRSTRRAARTWRGCVVGQRRAHFSPYCRPGRDRTKIVAGQ